MDIRAKDLLSKIRKIEGCENAVIAGGFVRDTILGGEKADVDIYIPAHNVSYFSGLRKPIYNALHPEETKKYTPLPLLKNIYGIYAEGKGYFKGKWDENFHDLEVDIMGFNFPNDESFGENVINTFHFGIDRAYYDGFTIIEDDKFHEDRKNQRVTLLHLAHEDQLSGSIAKFVKFQKKYPNWQFHTNILKLKTEEEIKNTTDYYQYKTDGIKDIDLMMIDEFVDFIDEDEDVDIDDEFDPEWEDGFVEEFVEFDD